MRGSKRGGVLRRELRPDCLGLDYTRPARFCKSQWECGGWSGAAYVAFKWVVGVYLVAGLLVNVVDVRALEAGESLGLAHRAKWFVYVTNWTLLVLTAQAVLAALLATDHHLGRHPPATSMSRLQKVYWLLNNVGNVGSPAITLLYWTSVYNKDVHRLDFGNIHGHVMNSVVVVADLLLTAHPVRLLHVLQPVGLGVSYATFSLLYFLAGGTNRHGDPSIYPFLNWSKPLVAISYVSAACVLLGAVHVLMWLFYQLRRALALRLGTLSPDEASPFPPPAIKLTMVMPLPDPEKQKNPEEVQS